MRGICIMGEGAAVNAAARILEHWGFCLTGPEQAQYLLYDIPTPAFLRDEIPADKHIIGGNLDFLPTYAQKTDLLKDEAYVAANAALTAEAGVGLIAGSCARKFRDTRALILGWGRIGKCLARLLRELGLQVCVCARRSSELVLAAALGYESRSAEELEDLVEFHYIVNTVPGPILADGVWNSVGADAALLEMASKPGIPVEKAIQARGLPGKYKALASAELIAGSIRRILGGG